MSQEQTDVQNFLQMKLEEFKQKNARFSIRSYAKRLDMPSGALSEILNGQRRISRKMVERICSKLALEPSERYELLKNFSTRTLAGQDSRHEQESIKLSADQFNFISNWIHFALLSLMNTSGFKSSSKWMAKRLGQTEDDVIKALARMEELGLIHKQDDGEWQRTKMRINTSDDVLNISIQRAHQQDLEMIRAKMTEVPVMLRDFTSVTFPANPKYLPAAKDIIRKAQAELADLMKQDHPKTITCI